MIELPKANRNIVIKSPARIRLERDFQDLALPHNIRVVTVDYDAMLVHFRLFPDEGPFSGGIVDFDLKIPPLYPHSPPKARIHQKLFHPNFDLEGHVCLNILRLDWNPVLPITAVMFGLLSILLEPEGEEALNQDAGNMLLKDPVGFNKVARLCAQGVEYEGIKYDCIIGIQQAIN